MSGLNLLSPETSVQAVESVIVLRLPVRSLRKRASPETSLKSMSLGRCFAIMLLSNAFFGIANHQNSNGVSPFRRLVPLFLLEIVTRSRCQARSLITLINVNRMTAANNARRPTRPKAIEISVMFVTSTPVFEYISMAHSPNARDIARATADSPP